MKKIFYYLSITFILASCGSNNTPENNVTIQSTAVPGFNINNFANLVKRTKSPADIETAINSDGNDINNLDLNKDGKVDFLKVVESQNQIQVVDDIAPTDSVNIATLTITKNNNVADMQIQGSPAYSGDDYQYHSSFSLGEVLLFAYIFSPHRYYVPMYHYGYYPSYYHSYSTTTYRTVTRTNSGGMIRSSGSSRSSLGSPSTSQRAFSTRSSSSPVRSGGFGRSSSRSSFGTGRSSFGRRH